MSIFRVPPSPFRQRRREAAAAPFLSIKSLPASYPVDHHPPDLPAGGYFNPSELPVALIPLPDTRQRDYFACGACAAMAVGRYFGRGPKSLTQWKKKLGTNIQLSTHPLSIAGYLEEALGLQVEVKDHLTLDDLLKYWQRGWPVICPIQDYGDRVPPRARFAYGHYVTVIGVGHGYVYVQDSTADNVLSGTETDAAPGRVMIEANLFLEKWYDRDLEGNPFVRMGIAVGPPKQHSKLTERFARLGSKALKPPSVAKQKVGVGRPCSDVPGWTPASTGCTPASKQSEPVEEVTVKKGEPPESKPTLPRRPATLDMGASRAMRELEALANKGDLDAIGAYKIDPRMDKAEAKKVEHFRKQLLYVLVKHEEAAKESYQQRTPERSLASLASSPSTESKPLDGGANKSFLLHLQDGGKCVFKPQAGEDVGFRSTVPDKTMFRREVAAYRLAEALGFIDLVPATTFRSENGQVGSAQEFAGGAESAFLVAGERAFDGPVDEARAVLFDYILGHADRRDGNWLVGRDGKLVLIDNGLSLPVRHEPKSYFEFALWKHAAGRNLPVPEVSGLKEKWPAARQALEESGIEPEAIELTRQRLETVVSGKYKTIGDLPAFWEKNKTMAEAMGVAHAR